MTDGMTELERILSELTPGQQRELLARLETGDGQEGDDVGPRRLGATRAPLSSGQLGLWFLNQLRPGSPAYHVSYAITVAAAADQDAWRSALADLVSRHEVLRTRFETGAGSDGAEPVQVIEPAADVPFEVVDLGQLAADRAAAERDDLARASARRPFDLGRAPLLRALLLPMGDTEHVLVLTLHHIVFDGWSVGVLMRELSAMYAARTRGRVAELPDLPVQYADFAVWQREQLTEQRLRSHLGYWREHLADLPVLELPTDRPRPPVQEDRGATLTFTVPATVVNQIRTLAQRHGATMFMTLLATVHTLLSRYTATTAGTDIAVATPIANRTRPELEHLIGFFVNTIPLRTTPPVPDPTFGELLHHVRATTLGALPHQELPFDHLVQHLWPHRTLSHNPISPVFLTVPPAVDHQLPSGWRMEPVDIGASRCDLTLSFEEGTDEIAATVEYDRDLFDAATIERLSGHLTRLLESAAADPTRRLSELPMLTAGEERALHAWSRGRVTAYPRDRLVHELVAQQARTRPAAVAVTTGEHTMSYEQLIASANRFAHALREFGVGPETAVGCCLDRSPELIVSLLGILIAGGAYVPLDPEYPDDRLRFMLSDSGAGLLVTTAARRIPGWFGPVLAVDEVRFQHWPAAAPPKTTSPQNLAYVMYTSGSTGRPKGIGVAHYAINRLVRDTDYVDLGPSDRVAHTSNLSFDSSTLEVWGALTNGGRVVLVPREVVLDPVALAAELHTQRVTTMFLTPQLFGQTVRAVPDAFAEVSHLLVGGDAMEPDPVRATLRPGCRPGRLSNGYGPTECTTFATNFRVESLPDGAVNVPIGRPIANTCTYVLDRRLRPTPVGVPGELYIGGHGVARGYHGRPALTAQRFLPDPFADQPGSRMYRTGDRVRWLPNGVIEYLGRLDRQVKVRGYRIELGEIEARLVEHPAVAAAAVTARPSGGQRALAAYLVPAAVAAPAARDLRAWLAQTLPGYMVPASFTILPELPLTPNGKLDRDALPDPQAPQPVDQGYLAPRDEIEQAVAAVWGELLGVRQLDARDNFFALGGHSLLATQAVNRLRAEFGMEHQISVRTLFEAPTVEGFAAAVVEAVMAGMDPEQVDRLLTEHGGGADR